MRNTIFAFIALVAITGYTRKVMADEVIGGAPSRAAELIEMHGAATYTALQRKTITEYRESGETEGFKFDESSLYCLGLECSQPVMSSWFAVTEVKVEQCNTITFYAEEVNPKGEPRQMIVSDHTQRTCRDYRPLKWEVKIEGPKTRYFAGNPATF